MSVEKRFVNRCVLLAAWAVLALVSPTWAAQSDKNPVKVFILAGQSNMEGHGRITGEQKGTLETLSKDPASAARYRHLLDKDGKWIARDDVYLSEKNMVSFIKDVRKDLGVPNLPFVIGGSGFGGWGQKIDRRLGIMKAQAAMETYDELKGNVKYVETRGFFRDGPVSPRPIRYHWCCNAESYYLIGEGMGKAMVELLGGPKAPPNPTGPEEER